MKLALLIAVIPLILPISGFAQNDQENLEPGTGKTVYTNKSECLDDLVAVASRMTKTPYKLLGHDVIAHMQEDGSVEVLRANGRITKVLPNDDKHVSCIDDSRYVLRGYNTILLSAYKKSEADVKAGKHNQTESAALEACPDQEGGAGWFKEAQINFETPKQNKRRDQTR
jgi:hypothetical protein